MRTINIGRLNRRVKLLKHCEIEDTMGQQTQALVTLKTVWGSFYPIRGNEMYEVQKLQGEVTHKCYIRYIPGIDSNNYISIGGKDYAVKSAIDVDGEHKMLEIYCYERINKEAEEHVGE